MATQRSSFQKLQRDRAKKEKAAAKRERRQERGSDDLQAGDEVETEPKLAPSDREALTADLLAKIEVIHQQFDAGTMKYEDFEEAKADLLSRLPMD